jgi:hypothetical protein
MRAPRAPQRSTRRSGAQLEACIEKCSYGRKGFFVTCDAHKPKRHSDYGEWPPERMLGWAQSIGPSVHAVVEKIFARYPRPELGYRPFLAATGSRSRVGCPNDHRLRVDGTPVMRFALTLETPTGMSLAWPSSSRT